MTAFVILSNARGSQKTEHLRVRVEDLIPSDVGVVLLSRLFHHRADVMQFHWVLMVRSSSLPDHLLKLLP